jgi:hypothetical protein
MAHIWSTTWDGVHVAPPSDSGVVEQLPRSLIGVVGCMSVGFISCFLNPLYHLSILFSSDAKLPLQPRHIIRLQVTDQEN